MLFSGLAVSAAVSASVEEQSPEIQRGNEFLIYFFSGLAVSVLLTRDFEIRM